MVIMYSEWPRYKGVPNDFIPQLIESLFDLGENIAYRIKHKKWRPKELNIKGYNYSNIYHRISSLKKRGIVSKSSDGYFKFTNEGLLWVKKSVKRYFETKQEKWDGKWRLVIFDVPKELHNQRINFGRKLKSMGFYMLQKSVFIFPYKCHEEISDVSKMWNISNYVDILTVDDPGFKKKELLDYYKL